MIVGRGRCRELKKHSENNNVKGAMSRRFCCILVKTAEIFYEEAGL